MLLRLSTAILAAILVLLSRGVDSSQVVGSRADRERLKPAPLQQELTTEASALPEDDPDQEKDKNDVVEDVRVYCNSEDISLSITVNTDFFNGMIYPKGLSKNSSCMTEYINQEGIILYKLPLRSCNTMFTDVVDGIEYFNTIVVQPHRKLVTNQGRGFHIRCRYRVQEKTLSNNFNVSGLGSTPVTATAAMPGASMRIFYGDPVEGLVAESVKIGDPLTLVVSIDDQDIYGMSISSCLVRDGLGWSQQQLINKEGCPEDYEIMGEFEYSSSKTTALVRFQAHKFPYTSSVYYQCNVRLCIRHAGGCDDVPPICENGENIVKRRRKRQVIELSDGDASYDVVDREQTIMVYNGLNVREADDLEDEEYDELEESVVSEYNPNHFCISQKNFAIGIAICGLILMIAVIIAILILVSKRRRKNLSTTGSSIYSGPYTNTAYSHSSLSRRS